MAERLDEVKGRAHLSDSPIPGMEDARVFSFFYGMNNPNMHFRFHWSENAEIGTYEIAIVPGELGSENNSWETDIFDDVLAMPTTKACLDNCVSTPQQSANITVSYKLNIRLWLLFINTLYFFTGII